MLIKNVKIIRKKACIYESKMLKCDTDREKNKVNKKET